MSGNIYWRGRQKALQEKKQKNWEPPASVKPKKPRSVTQKIRDVKRLLAREGLPEDVKKEKEILLDGLERIRKQQLDAERERKFAKKYHKVKFFERQKLTRRIKQVRRELQKITQTQEKQEGEKAPDSAAPQEDEKSLREQLEKLEGDLKYVLNFPNSERYISILKEITDEAVLAKRTALREQILSRPNLRTGDEKEERSLGEAMSEEDESMEDDLYSAEEELPPKMKDVSPKSKAAGKPGKGADAQKEKEGNGKAKEEQTEKEKKKKGKKKDVALQQNNAQEKKQSGKGTQGVNPRSDGDEADDEDDKEERDKEIAGKPPKKKARIAENTETDPQEYGGEPVPSLDKDPFFMSADGPVGDDDDDEEEEEEEEKVQHKRRRADADNNRRFKKKQSDRRFSNNNSRQGYGAKGGAEASARRDSTTRKGGKAPRRRDQKENTSGNQNNQNKRRWKDGKEGNNTSSPTKKQYPRQQPPLGGKRKGQEMERKGARQDKGARKGKGSDKREEQGMKRKWNTNSAKPNREDDDKVEEVPSRKRRRSGEVFSAPVGGASQQQAPRVPQKEKQHVFF